MTTRDWSRPCLCGHQQSQHRGAKRTGGCVGWNAEALKRCDCKGWRSTNPRLPKPILDDKPQPPKPKAPRARRPAPIPDDRPLAPVVDIETRRRRARR